MRRLAIALVVLAAGCPDRSISVLTPSPDNVENKDIPVDLNRNLDLLFMIDNSSSMTSKQQHVKDNFPTFINVLQNITGGLPSVHIGIVSSDLGDGDFAGCPAGSGDDGRLQSTAHPGTDNPNCTGPTPDKYLIDIANPDGTRTTNYDTTQGLASTFTCVATLGATGCGFEHQLGSVVRALDPSNAFNNGFLRDDAYLGIVFVTDEDDCTASNPALYDQSNQNLGPLASFRCTRYGVKCDQDTNAIGVKSNCVASTTDPYFADGIDQQVAAIKALKPNPDKDIVVAAIMAPPTPVEVIPAPSTESDPGSPFLKESCDASFGHGDPAFRIDYFLNQFTQHTETSVCEDSYQDGLQQIANAITNLVGDPCLRGDLKDLDPDTAGVQPDCTVSEVMNPDTASETQTIVPECDASHSVTPCWYLMTDTTHCDQWPTQLALTNDYGGVTPAISDHIRAQCVIN